MRALTKWLQRNAMYFSVGLLFTCATVALLATLSYPSTARAEPETPVGLWLASDSEDDMVRSVVSISEEQGMLFGRIVKLVDRSGDEVNSICRHCHSSIEGKPMKGLVFIRNLRRQGDRWVGGRVYDIRPEWKWIKDADCELFVRDGRLHFIGRVGVFSHESVWSRYELSNSAFPIRTTP